MKLLCVVGPTACGKTRMGVALAQQYHGEVVSVDSMQIYRGMSIGTAAPTEAEMAGIPHHMVGVADPRENWSAARFIAEADRCVQDILARGRRPVLVGGTGLYLDALVAGRVFAAGSAGSACRAALYRELETGGIGPLWEELKRVDPARAQRLHPSDQKRILRALEVYRETGETITEHDRRSRAQPPKYEAAYIGLTYRNRVDLWAAVDRRVDAMMAAGLVDELRALLKQGTPGTAMQAIGYKELLRALRGEQPIEEAVAEIKLRSRQYAKRQLTWLRRNPHIHWIYWEKERDFAAALQIVTEFLMLEGLQ